MKSIEVVVSIGDRATDADGNVTWKDKKIDRLLVSYLINDKSARFEAASSLLSLLERMQKGEV